MLLQNKSSIWHMWEKQMLKEHAELIYVSVCVSGANGKLTDVLTLLIQYLDDPDSDPTVSLCVFLFTDAR